MSNYIQAHDGDWFRPQRKDFKLACCDCGLVHTINFRIINRHIELQFIRDKRSTAAVRRKKKQ